MGALSALPDRLQVVDGGGVLVGMRCVECGTTFLGAVERCRRCTSEQVESTELGNAGELYSYTVVHRAAADWQGPQPYALAEVVLPAGVAVTSRIADWQEGDPIEIGSRYELATESIGRDEDGNDQLVYLWRRPETGA